jgi:hypothetical protein
MEEVNNSNKEKLITTPTSFYFSKSSSECKNPNFTSYLENYPNDISYKELMINQDEYKLYFGTERSLLKEIKDTEIEINFGPKVYLDTFTKCQFDRSLDNIEENSIIDILDNGQERPELESPSNSEEEDSDNTESKKEVLIQEDNIIVKEDSKFSFHINGNNSVNQMKYPPRLNMNNILHTSFNIDNEINTNHRSNNLSTSRIEKQGCIGCCKTKKTQKYGNASTFPIFNNQVPPYYTKRSTNISIKSLKLNDSIQKHRRRKSQFSIATDDLNYSKKLAEKPTSCRCVIF